MSYLELARKASTGRQAADKHESDCSPAIRPTSSFPDRDGFQPEVRISNADTPTCNPHAERQETTDIVAGASLPRGIRLIHWQPKQPPVMIESYAVVTDVQKFIAAQLRELDARLHAPVQIRGGFGIFTILDWLAQCGVELEIVHPHKNSVIPETQK